jgi:predicted PurR-regulated permease PerM
MTSRIRRLVTGFRDRLVPDDRGSSASAAAAPSAAEPFIDVPPEPMGPIAVSVRVVGVVLLALLLVALTWALRGMVLNVFLALLVAAGLLPSTRRFERRFSRPVAAILVNVVVIGALIVVILIVARPVLAAIGAFIAGVPELVEAFQAWLESVLGTEAYNQLFAETEPVAIPWGGLLGLTVSAVMIAANVVIIIIIEVFLLVERRSLMGGILEFMDSDDRPATRRILTQGVESLGNYLRGLLVSMSFIGVATGIGMLLIGIPYVVPMSLVAFFTAAIPYIGGLFALIPILLIAAAEVGPHAVVLMIVWQVVIQQIEGSYVTPTVQGKAVAVSPLVVMLGVTAGITLGGLVGGIIAIPIAALIGVGLRGVVLPMRRRAEAREQARRDAYLAAAAATARSATPPA